MEQNLLLDLCPNPGTSHQSQFLAISCSYEAELLYLYIKNKQKQRHKKIPAQILNFLVRPLNEEI